MALPTTGNSWFGGIDLPSQMFDMDSEYELYEEDDQFVLSVELPGYDPDEITVTWDEGTLNIAAEHKDDRMGRRRTYHRRFRFPKTVEDTDIEAQYTNGILEVRLPVVHDAIVEGREIEIQS